MVGIEDDPWLAWCFDEAAFMWYNHVENHVHDTAKNVKNEQQRIFMKQGALRAILRVNELPTTESTKGMFRDPAAIFGGK